MLDPIITSHKLTIYLCVTYLENKQYPVNTTYNNRLENVTPKTCFSYFEYCKNVRTDFMLIENSGEAGSRFEIHRLSE